MNKELREKLERPFDAKAIRKRRGPGNKEFSYVAVGEYVSRLNQVLGTENWSFRITAREHHEREVLVEGILVAAGTEKFGIGGAELRRTRDGEIMSLSDSFKAASSDCLKRCCRLLGIGLALYQTDKVVDASPAQGQVSGGRGVSIFEPPTQQERGGRISRAQLDKLHQLVDELGAEWASFRSYIKEQHGVAVEYASKQLASDLIGDLIAKAQARRGNGALNHGGIQ